VRLKNKLLSCEGVSVIVRHLWCRVAIVGCAGQLVSVDRLGGDDIRVRHLAHTTVPRSFL